jgi:pimeloyl-ACP methyl ester carboxylesterase
MIEARYLTVRSALVFVEIHTPDTAQNEIELLPTVVCLHTAGQSGVQWRDTASSLAERGYRVMVPDLPGHGRSEPAVDGPVTDLEIYGDIVWDVLDAMDVERPVIVGCSIGGKITLDLALRAGRPLAGAIVMEADAAPGRVSVRGLQRELEDVAGPSRAERTYLGTLASVGDSVEPRRAHLIASMHKREDPEISSSDLIGWGTHDVQEHFSLLTCPVQFVVGTQDCWVDVKAIERTATLIRESTIHRVLFTVLENIGHYPMEEIENFSALANGWIRELTRDDAPEHSIIADTRASVNAS